MSNGNQLFIEIEYLIEYCLTHRINFDKDVKSQKIISNIIKSLYSIQGDYFKQFKLNEHKLEELQSTIRLISDAKKNLTSQKKSLTLIEACEYCSLSKSTMYKLTSSKKIPHYKPFGKYIYFEKQELDQWLLQNRQTTQEELLRKATNYSLNKSFKFKS